MRTPAELRLDYIKNSGDWLKWIKGVQDEAWNAAMDKVNQEIKTTSLPIETKIIVQQIAKILKK